MKRLLLTAIWLLLFIIVKGQDGKLSIGIIGSPDYYFLSVKKNEATNFSYNPCFNYSLGFVAKYNFGKRFSAKTGILYSDRSYNVNWDWQLYPDGVPDPAFPDDSKMESSYLDFPLMVSYNFFTKNKLTYYVSSGLTYSFLSSNKEISIMQDGTERETDFLHSIYDIPSSALNLELELGLKYDINNQLFLTLEPYYRYVINEMSNELLDINQSILGIRLGLNLNIITKNKTEMDTIEPN